MSHQIEEWGQVVSPGKMAWGGPGISFMIHALWSSLVLGLELQTGGVLSGMRTCLQSISISMKNYEDFTALAVRTSKKLKKTNYVTRV